MHFSYDKILRDETNFTDTVTKIEKLLHVWSQRSLTLEGKITIFKTLTISKIVYIAYLSKLNNYRIEKNTKCLFVEWKKGQNCSLKLSVIPMKKGIAKCRY